MSKWFRKEALTAIGLVIVAVGQLGFAAGFLPGWANLAGYGLVAAGSIMYLTGR